MTDHNTGSTNLSSPSGDRGAVGRIFLIGFMGCGKTHWGQQLSQRLGIPFFDLDQKIEEQQRKTINELFAEEGEEHFRLLEKEVLHLLTENHESFVMACGGGTPCYFNTIDYMKKQGTVVWLNCSIECLYTRLEAGKDKRPLIRNLSNDQLRAYIIKKFADRKIYYEQATLIVEEDNLTLDSLVNQLFPA